MLERVRKIVDQIRTRTDFVPEIGIILGTGLDPIGESVDELCRIPYAELAGMPVSTAPGHRGCFVFGYIEGRPVVIMRGRLHHYEGYSTQETTIPVRVMILLGVRILMVSNAAGGTGDGFVPGDLMLIRDHINFIPNPLIGANVEQWGERFPAMRDAYDPALAEIARKKADELGIDLKEGVYVSLTGPSFETDSEYRFVKLIGGSAVGMSTTPEVIVARHMGARVLAVSLISNVAFSAEPVSQAQVVAQSNASAGRLSQLFKSVISEL